MNKIVAKYSTFVSYSLEEIKLKKKPMARINTHGDSNIKSIRYRNQGPEEYKIAYLFVDGEANIILITSMTCDGEPAARR
jgi:hypothetical protein